MKGNDLKALENEKHLLESLRIHPYFKMLEECQNIILSGDLDQFDKVCNKKHNVTYIVLVKGFISSKQI
ncbi:hypothetical protein DF121_20230 [Burkholderia stagnalis]|nr:hypothetical protein DF145_21050 [Burkholderia stagnalis]RQX98168.1 hypothetical protein DF121_20230 [Burkholderia stagnalis]RQY12273.1 hypothetical protein DF115_23350 [Burkholderia stagnalis]RQY28478.1 hypothetical protein DF114_22285 [Burkholderia stagnalis]